MSGRLTAQEIRERTASDLEKSFERFGPNGEHWIKKTARRRTISGRAFAFCTWGACKETVEKETDDIDEQWDRMVKMLYWLNAVCDLKDSYRNCIAFNDLNEWPEVRSLWFDAIEKAKAEK